MICFSLFGENNIDKTLRTADQMIRVGDYEKAEDQLRVALRNNPENGEILWRLGKALNRKAMRLSGMKRHDTFEEASQILAKAIKYDRKSPEPHVEMARTLGYMGLFKPDWDNYNLAGRISEELDYAIKQDAEYADAYFVYGLWNRFVCKRSLLVRMPYDLGEACDELALENLQKAVEYDDENAEYMLELGKQYLYMERFDEARDIFKKTTEFKSNLFTKRYIKQAEEQLETMDK